MTEQDKFLEGLTNDQRPLDILETPFSPEPEKAETTEEDEKQEDDKGDIEPKNRRERRLMRKLQEERESAMYLSGKLAAQTEARHAVDEESDYLKLVDRIYGTETPEAQLATDLLKKALVGAREDAKKQAVEELRSERQRELDEEKKAQDQLDGFVEEIEDTYDISLSDAQERAFFQLLQKMSPKDRSGNVIEYADPHAVWEVFNERLQRRGTDNRAKELSSRSMVQSGASKESTLQDDSHYRYLKENGIL